MILWFLHFCLIEMLVLLPHPLPQPSFFLMMSFPFSCFPFFPLKPTDPFSLFISGWKTDLFPFSSWFFDLSPDLDFLSRGYTPLSLLLHSVASRPKETTCTIFFYSCTTFLSLSPSRLSGFTKGLRNSSGSIPCCPFRPPPHFSLLPFSLAGLLRCPLPHLPPSFPFPQQGWPVPFFFYFKAAAELTDRPVPPSPSVGPLDAPYFVLSLILFAFLPHPVYLPLFSLSFPCSRPWFRQAIVVLSPPLPMNSGVSSAGRFKIVT